MPGRDDRWLHSELEECLDSWRGAIETEGHGSYAAIVWQGRADQALRTAIHFGVVEPEEGRARMMAIDSRIPVIRALVEPDGEGGD